MQASTEGSEYWGFVTLTEGKGVAGATPFPLYEA